MLDYISPIIDKYDNEGKISWLLKDLNLPDSLDSGINASTLVFTSCFNISLFIDDIADYLWSRISEVQSKEKTNCLMKQINAIEQASQGVNNNLVNMENILFVIIKLFIYIKFHLERRQRR